MAEVRRFDRHYLHYIDGANYSRISVEHGDGIKPAAQMECAGVYCETDALRKLKTEVANKLEAS